VRDRVVWNAGMADAVPYFMVCPFSVFFFTGDRKGNSRAKPIHAECPITEVSSLCQLPAQGRATPALTLGR